MKKTDEDKIEEALQDADEACEGSNYHDRFGLARYIYKACQNLVPKESRVKLAKAISKAVSNI